MESIYFEKQEGSLCAQHCLNALLQGQYFTAVDLAKIAKDLDDDEKRTMCESGEDSEEYRKFLQQPSQNMDDSGYFSLQVISRCLAIWGLELVRFGSTEQLAVQAKNCPETMNAYICNYKEHWFTIRQLAGQWFNLNSMSKGPKLISHTFLSLFLAQLKQEGYSIFIVVGELPHCEADNMIENNLLARGTMAPPSSPNMVNDMAEDVAMDDTDDSDFKRTLELSLCAQRDFESQREDQDLKRAIELSLQSSEHIPQAGCSGMSGGVTAMEEGASGGVEQMDAELDAASRLRLDCVDVESNHPS